MPRFAHLPLHPVGFHVTKSQPARAVAIDLDEVCAVIEVEPGVTNLILKNGNPLTVMGDYADMAARVDYYAARDTDWPTWEPEPPRTMRSALSQEEINAMLGASQPMEPPPSPTIEPRQ